jgi:hypothetical protein
MLAALFRAGLITTQRDAIGADATMIAASRSPLRVGGRLKADSVIRVHPFVMFPPIALLREGSAVVFDAYRALQRLADVPRGIAKTLMIAYGFDEKLLSDLVLVGFVTVKTDTARIGEQTIEVELVMITDAGRKAMWVPAQQPVS